MSQPELSICMVSLNCLGVVTDCLASLRSSDYRDFEIIVVDNGSVDGTVEYLRGQSDVLLSENGWNAGFTKGTNKAIELSKGEFVLWLNTDTILRPDSLGKLLEFMKSHPQAGVVGPKVLNADGTFQGQCKRGLPTPLASLGYLLGLRRVFPKVRVFSQYLLDDIDEDESHVVAAVSGCCLLTRRHVISAVGPLDESMFAFGEDLDWCVRAGKAGYEVWFFPGSVITHLKGMGGVHSKPFHKVWGMHQGMWRFYEKHLRKEYPGAVTALVAVGVAISFSGSMARAWARRQLAVLRSLISGRPVSP